MSEQATRQFLTECALQTLAARRIDQLGCEKERLDFERRLGEKVRLEEEMRLEALEKQVERIAACGSSAQPAQPCSPPPRSAPRLSAAYAEWDGRVPPRRSTHVSVAAISREPRRGIGSGGSAGSPSVGGSSTASCAELAEIVEKVHAYAEGRAGCGEWDGARRLLARGLAQRGAGLGVTPRARDSMLSGVTRATGPRATGPGVLQVPPIRAAKLTQPPASSGHGNAETAAAPTAGDPVSPAAGESAAAAAAAAQPRATKRTVEELNLTETQRLMQRLGSLRTFVPRPSSSAGSIGSRDSAVSGSQHGGGVTCPTREAALWRSLRGLRLVSSPQSSEPPLQTPLDWKTSTQSEEAERGARDGVGESRVPRVCVNGAGEEWQG